MRKMPAALLAVALLIGGCNSAPDREDATAQLEDGATRADGAIRGDDETIDREGGGKKDRDARVAEDRDGSAEESGPTTPGGTETADTSNEGSAHSGGRSGGSRTETASTSPGTPQPRSGRYVYAQSGWEEFCTGTCQRSDLPSSAEIDTDVAPVGSGMLRVITESRSSEDRSMRATSFVSRSVVELAELELTYGRFSNTYKPDPPVRSLELPLEVGNSWSSSWEADTSGTYSAEILGREVLVVGDRRIETFKVDTLTRFRGDFRGTMASVVWVDPETATSIRTHGKARIETDYGRFNSKFDTTLIDGPGYE